MDENKQMEGAETTTSNMSTEEGHRISGPILVLLVMTLLMVLGLLYLWFATIQMRMTDDTTMTATRPTAEENNEPESTTAEAQAGSFQVVSNSDEIDAIDADLESTNLDALDAELNAIDAELNAAVQ